MPSRPKTTPIVHGRGIFGGRGGGGGSQLHDHPTVEIDKKFGRLLNLFEGQKVWNIEHVLIPGISSG